MHLGVVAGVLLAYHGLLDFVVDGHNASTRGTVKEKKQSPLINILQLKTLQVTSYSTKEKQRKHVAPILGIPRVTKVKQKAFQTEMKTVCSAGILATFAKHKLHVNCFWSQIKVLFRFQCNLVTEYAAAS